MRSTSAISRNANDGVNNQLHSSTSKFVALFYFLQITKEEKLEGVRNLNSKRGFTNTGNSTGRAIFSPPLVSAKQLTRGLFKIGGETRRKLRVKKGARARVEKERMNVERKHLTEYVFVT